MRHKYSLLLILLLGLLLSLCDLGSASYAEGYCNDSYYTPEQYTCMFSTKPSPFGIAQSISKDSTSYSKYEVLIDPHNFNQPVEPIHVIYALYLIAERIGDQRASDKKKWLERYLDNDTIDDINSAVFCKYSKAYLKNCFSPKGPVPGTVANPNYPIYMDY